MELHFGAQLRGATGDRFGILHRIVIDEQSRRVVGVSVQRVGMDNYEVLVPIEVITNGDDEAVVANLIMDQFDELYRFNRTRNVAPPPDAAEVVETNIDDPIDIPDVPPVGAATGVESIAFTPIVQDTMNVQPGEVVLDGTTTIEATDGEVGRVRGAVLEDGSAKILALFAQRGVIFTHDTLVPHDAIDAFEGETLRLRVDRAALQERET